jgi:serine/threonine protein kinase
MTLVGTPAYMAPEVINQNRYSEKADVYSFGIVLGELWNGEVPYSDIDLFPEQVRFFFFLSSWQVSLILLCEGDVCCCS